MIGPLQSLIPRCRLCLAVGAEDVNDLVRYHLLDLVTSDLEVAAGVKYGGLCGHYAADACGERETDIRVDIDLADCHLSSAAKQLLRNALSAVELTAASVDLVNELRNNGGCAVKNDREAGEALAYLLEDIEAQTGSPLNL